MNVYVVEYNRLTIKIKDDDILGKLSINELESNIERIDLTKGKIVIPNIPEIKNRVNELGFVEFDNYLLEDYYNKELVVIYGNCHTTAITDMLMQCEEFCKKYVIYRVTPICEIKSVEYFNHPVFRNCDVFFHQSIRKENRYGKEFASENVIAKLKKDCRIIAIPNVYHLPMCFFPQYIEKKEFKYNSKTTIFFRDRIIDEMYLNGCNIDEIKKNYIDENFYLNRDLENKFNIFIDKIRLREKDWDIKVSEFILKNYKDNQLFYDPNHPTVYFFRYIVKECLNILQVPFDENEINKIEITPFETYEMPICASVKAYFKMTYPNKMLREYGIKLKNEEMDLDSYIRQYIAFEWQNDEATVFKRVKSLSYYLTMGGTKLLLTRVINYIKRHMRKVLGGNKNESSSNDTY